MVPALCTYGTLALCAILIAYVVWRYDLYDHEPWYTLAIALVCGFGFMWLAGLVQIAAINAAVRFWPEGMGNPLAAALAGVSEEIAKVSAVGVIALGFRRVFNDPMDGIIYGSFAGLGAAIFESILNIGVAPPSPVLPGQEFIRLAGHLVFGGIGGYGLGLLAINAPWWRARALLCLAAAAIIHTVWDLIAFAGADYFHEHGSRARWHVVASLAIMVTGMVVFRWLVVRGERLSRVKFASPPPPPPPPAQAQSGAPGV